MKKLLAILGLTLMTFGCTPEPCPVIEEECLVTIEVINTYTGQHVGVTVDNYQMLYDLYIKNGFACEDIILDYGNHTIIYTTLKTL